MNKGLLYKVCFKPLTPYAPFFVGDGKPLSPYVYPVTRKLPTILTVTGTLFSILYSHGIDSIILRRSILNEDIIVYGVYVLDTISYDSQHLGDVVACARPLVAVKAIVEKDGTISRRCILEALSNKWGYSVREPDSMASYVSCLDIELKPCFHDKDSHKETVFVSPIGITSSLIYRLVSRSKQFIGIALDRRRKIVREPGGIYSYWGAEEIKLCNNRGECSDRVFYCIDLVLRAEEEKKDHIVIVKKVLDVIAGKKIITKLGGKHSKAVMVVINAIEDNVLNKTLAYTILRSNTQSYTRLAVSHGMTVLMKNSDKYSLYTVDGEKIKWILGDIEIISGWDMAEKRAKTPILSLTPGTLFGLEATTSNKVLDTTIKTYNSIHDWWKKLLKTTISL